MPASNTDKILKEGLKVMKDPDCIIDPLQLIFIYVKDESAKKFGYDAKNIVNKSIYPLTFVKKHTALKLIKNTLVNQLDELTVPIVGKDGKAYVKKAKVVKYKVAGKYYFAVKLKGI